MSVRRHLAVIAAILATLPFSHVSAEIVSYEADRVDCTTFAPICRVEVSDITGTTSSEPSGSQESHVFNVRFSDMRHIEVVEPALILLSINLFFNPEESGGYSIFEISGALTNEFGESLITTSSFFNVSFNPNRIFVALEFFILDPSFIFHGFSLSASAPVNLTTGEVNGVDVTPGGLD